MSAFEPINLRMITERLVRESLSHASLDDVQSSATLALFHTNRGLLFDVAETLSHYVPRGSGGKMLDLGCGYGGLATVVGEILGFEERAGVDINQDRLRVAETRGLEVADCDIENDRLPFPSESFDLAISFGVMEHLKYLDNIIAEAHRVLQPGGCFLASTTNMASWPNRMSMLLGYQPRNIEISRHHIAGIHWFYRRVYTSVAPTGHVSSITLGAMKELLIASGFKVLKSWGAKVIPTPDKSSRILEWVDAILSRRPSLSVRFFTLAQKLRSPGV